MNGELEQLRESIEKSRAGQGGRWRCPPELRCRIATYMRERRMVGASLESIAVELGVSESSVSRWIAPPVPDRASVQLREVQIGGS